MLSKKINKLYNVYSLLIAFSCTNQVANQTKVSETDSNPCNDSSQIKEDFACLEVYDPVCGCDGKTYSNECLAKNSGLTNWEKGACED